MMGLKQEHIEILHYFDCILDNLDHCTKELSPGGCFSAHTPARGKAKLLEKRCCEFFYGCIEAIGSVGCGVFCREL